MKMVEALYNAPEDNIRCKIFRKDKEDYIYFNLKESILFELTMLHEHEFNSDNWEVFIGSDEESGEEYWVDLLSDIPSEK